MNLQNTQLIAILVIIAVIAGLFTISYLQYPAGFFRAPAQISEPIQQEPVIQPEPTPPPPEPAAPSTQQGVTRTYFYAGVLLASKSSDQTGTTYYIQDHLGSNRMVLDGEAQTNDFYAFGETKETTGTSDNQYKYTGKELDPETGLYYYGARYYKPELGRFVQADILRGSLTDPLSLNRYAYVQNNPLKYVDPTGSKKEEKNKILSHEEAIRLTRRQTELKESIKKSEKAYLRSLDKIIEELKTKGIKDPDAVADSVEKEVSEDWMEVIEKMLREKYEEFFYSDTLLFMYDSAHGFLYEWSKGEETKEEWFKENELPPSTAREIIFDKEKLKEYIEKKLKEEKDDKKEQQQIIDPRLCPPRSLPP